MKRCVRSPALMILLLALAVTLCACSGTAGIPSVSAQKAGGITASSDGATPPPSQPQTTQYDPETRAALTFSNDFTILPKTPVDADIEFFLWQASMAEDREEDAAAQASSESIAQLAKKYKQLVDSTGVHYVELSNALGMEMKAEYWTKDGKYRKLDPDLNQMEIFDGQYYYKINLGEKTAERYDKDAPFVSGDVQQKVYGMLEKLSDGGYIQQLDEKAGDFDCHVFYMDMEFMGYKGSRLYVDKATGLLVKNVTGDEKGGMTIEVTEFEQGGFGDDVFALPKGITIE